MILSNQPHRTIPGFRSLIVLLFSLGIFSTAALQQQSQQKAPAPKDDGERISPLKQDGPRFFKGNLHTHSFWSDGDDFPEMIADWYVRHGYDFLTLSDHNVLSEGNKWVDLTPARQPALKKYLARFGPAWVEQRQAGGKERVRLKPLREFRSQLEQPGRFLLIPGEEITHKYGLAPVHMNAINLRDVVVPISGDNVAETIRANQRAVSEQVKKTGWPSVFFLNHPNFFWGVRAEDLAAAEELRFFEVFNGHPSVNNYGNATRPGCERIWDIALSLRLGKLKLPVIYGLATDDAHGYHVFGVGKVNPGRGWICVRAPYLSGEAIVQGINKGEFYASTGIVLDDVTLNGPELSLKIRGEKGVKYRTQFIGTKKSADLTPEPVKEGDKPPPGTANYSKDIGVVLAESDSLTPTYRLTGEELYVRARIASTKPHPNPFQKGDVEVAWTQPITP